MATPTENPTGTGPEVKPDSGTVDPAGADPASTGDGEGEAALGDAGKKALDAMKGKWHTERDKRRELEARIAELEASKPPKADGKTPSVDDIKAEAAREALTKANARILRSEIKAAATGKLADPADAALYLDLSKFEVDANGDVDADEISEAIEDLITRKPHLAATAAKRFQGTGDGGARRNASGPTQITRDQLKSMTPAQIVKAKAEGRLNKVLGITG